MSGPNSVRSARARALLFVFGGWGWLGYRGQAGPSKPGFHHSWADYIRRRVYEMDYIRNPVGFEVLQLVLKWFNPVGYITAETQIDIYQEVKSGNTQVYYFPTLQHKGTIILQLELGLKNNDWTMSLSGAAVSDNSRPAQYFSWWYFKRSFLSNFHSLGCCFHWSW